MHAGPPHRAQERRPDEIDQLRGVMKHWKPVSFPWLEIDVFEGKEFNSIYSWIGLDRSIHHENEKGGIRMVTFERAGQDASARELLSQHARAARYRFYTHSCES